MVHGYGTIEAVEWAMGTPKTPLVCLIHGMKVGLQVLGSWAKSQSLWVKIPSTRLISPCYNIPT